MPASPAATQYSAPGIASAAPPVIEVQNVVKTFNGRNVLDGVSLTVRRGETLVIMGASGCGKSTLLRCLIGAHRPDGGTIKLFDQDLWKLRTRELDKVRKRFGILFQSGALFSSMSVGENVALPLKEHTDLGADMIDLMVKVKLELVGLREAEDRLPSEISGGMAKRAGMARAIALDPELLFYDEPTSGLDPIMTGIIDGLITDLARTMNVTSVVVTHDLKSAFRVADRMVVLNNGRIVLQGLPHEIRASQDPFVRRFIHGPVESRTAMVPRTGSGFIPVPEGVTLVSSARNPISNVEDVAPVAAPVETAPTKESVGIDDAAPKPAAEVPDITPPADLVIVTSAPISDKREGTRLQRRPGSRAESPFVIIRKEEPLPVPDTILIPPDMVIQKRDKVGVADEIVEPAEAADELARELSLAHAPRESAEKSPEDTQLIAMDTMLIEGLGDDLPPAPEKSEPSADKKITSVKRDA